MSFCWHDWGKWSEYNEKVYFVAGILMPKESRGKTFEDVEYRQKRYCSKCNKVQDILVRD